GNFTTYAIRFLDEKLEPALSLFLQWGKPGEYEPGQVEAWQILKNVEGIAICEFSQKDVVRHPLVQRIVAAYEKYET
ncbi:MAG: PhoH family protein, partial [Dolichospermum sp.]